MPRLSVWFVRTALVALVAGSALGGAVLSARAWPGAGMAGVVPLHAELLLVGWLVNLAFGVALWILPKRALRDGTGYRTGPAGVAFVLLNAGILLAGTGAVRGGGGLLLAGRAAQVLAAASFALHVWSRVRPSGAERGAGAPS